MYKANVAATAPAATMPQHMVGIVVPHSNANRLVVNTVRNVVTHSDFNGFFIDCIMELQTNVAEISGAMNASTLRTSTRAAFIGAIDSDIVNGTRS